jgi:hypothetical protein
VCEFQAEQGIGSNSDSEKFQNVAGKVRLSEQIIEIKQAPFKNIN